MSSPALDHLVVMATSLDDGVRWCEEQFGIAPGPGGEHAFMGTHNRLLRIDSSVAPNAYLEIIAINSAASHARSAGLRRWFDMDSAVLQQQIAAEGPRLIHWVVRVPSIAPSLQALGLLGLDGATTISASRPTASGLLEWAIAVRDDGQRLMNGCLPTFIQWGAVHPSAQMAPSGIALQSLGLSHPEADLLRAALHAIGLGAIEVTQGPARILASLDTPRGTVALNS